MQLTELTEKHRQEQEEWTSAKTALEQRCSNVEVVSEQRRLELLVVQAKLMQAEGATKAQITDLRQALADAQFRMTMGEDKIRAILRRHKLNTLKMVSESMEKGWKTWSAQAAELQLLRADRENRKAQGQGFFKMTEEAISTIQEDIAKDLSEIAACHQEEVNRLMQEFDKHDIDTAVQFEAYEAERQRQTPGLSALDTATMSRPSTEPEQQMEESDDDDEHEPSLFDILDDDAEEDPEDDVPKDQQGTIPEVKGHHA